MKKLAKRLNIFDSSEIRKTFGLAKEIKNPLDLSIGQPDFDVPEEIKKSAIDSINQGNNSYTPTAGLLSLRKAIVKKLAVKNKIKTKPENVLVTAGTTGAIFLAFFTLLDPGDEVIILDPYFVAYKEIANLIGAKAKVVPTLKNYQPDVAAIKKAISARTKLIVINSPNNPTGAVYEKEKILEIIKLAKENNLTILSDEVYEDFIYEGEHFSPASIYDQVITLNGFSKSCAATGWRIGYALGPKEIIDQMAKIQQFTFVCAASFAQKAAIKALEYNNQHLIDIYRKKRDLIFNGLKDHFEVVKPNGAFYIFVKTPIDEKKFVQILLEKKVVVVPGKAFSNKKGYIRISYANKESVLKKAVEVIIKAGQ